MFPQFKLNKNFIQSNSIEILKNLIWNLTRISLILFS